MLKDLVSCAVGVCRFCSEVQVCVLPFVLCHWQSSDIRMLGPDGRDDNQVTEAFFHLFSDEATGNRTTSL